MQWISRPALRQSQKVPKVPVFFPLFFPARAEKFRLSPVNCSPKHSVEFIQVRGFLVFTYPCAVKGIACQLVEVFEGDRQVLKECAVIVVHVPAEIGRII